MWGNRGGETEKTISSQLQSAATVATFFYYGLISKTWRCTTQCHNVYMSYLLYQCLHNMCYIMFRLHDYELTFSKVTVSKWRRCRWCDRETTIWEMFLMRCLDIFQLCLEAREPGKPENYGWEGLRFGQSSALYELRPVWFCAEKLHWHLSGITSSGGN